MDIRNIIDAKRFDPSKLVKQNLFESEHLFCDVYGLTPGQEQKPHAHESCDKIYYVVEGCGLFKIGDDVREVGEKNAVYVPAGVEHGVKNDSTANLALLVVVAPHPNYVRKPMPG